MSTKERLIFLFWLIGYSQGVGFMYRETGRKLIDEINRKSKMDKASFINVPKWLRNKKIGWNKAPSICLGIAIFGYFIQIIGIILALTAGITANILLISWNLYILSGLCILQPFLYIVIRKIYLKKS